MEEKKKGKKKEILSRMFYAFQRSSSLLQQFHSSLNLGDVG